MSEGNQRFLRAVGSALDEVTQTKFCAFAGAKECDVSQARNGKRKWQQEWTDQLLEMPDLSEARKIAIVEAIAARAGLKAVKREKKTHRQVAMEAIATLRRFGEMGAGFADSFEHDIAAIDAEGAR